MNESPTKWGKHVAACARLRLNQSTAIERPADCADLDQAANQFRAILSGNKATITRRFSFAKLEDLDAIQVTYVGDHAAAPGTPAVANSLRKGRAPTVLPDILAQLQARGPLTATELKKATGFTNSGIYKAVKDPGIVHEGSKYRLKRDQDHAPAPEPTPRPPRVPRAKSNGSPALATLHGLRDKLRGDLAAVETTIAALDRLERQGIRI